MSFVKVGDAQFCPVLEMSLLKRPISYLGAEPSLIDASRHWLSPWFLEEGDTWSLNFLSWILRVDEKIVVIDPCTGNGRPHALAAFNMLEEPFIERFVATGVLPEDVDFVFCTHFHHDHCGWNTRLRDGRWTPTFPNARYIFLRRECIRWDPRRAGFKFVEYNSGVYERSILPIVEAGLAEVVSGQHKLSPSLTIVPAYGHTRGHAMLHLQSNKEEAFFSGDCFHHPLQLAAPSLQFGDCDNLRQAISARQRLVELGLEREALIIPAHLPTPHCGNIRRDAESGVWFEAHLSA